MKFNIIVLLLFLASIKANCQLDRLRKFYSEKLNDANMNNSFTIYKINGKIYKTDHENFFSLGESKLYVNKTNDIVNFMIYKKKYLFIGYFPNTKENIMRAVPSEVWALDKLEIIDLDDKSKKWTYKFKNMTAMGLIKTFNPKDGDIVYCNHIKPEKVVTD